MKPILTNFLPRINVTNDFEPVYDTDVILQSIYTILVTRKGSRKTQPDFGCNLLTYLFAPFEDTTIDAIKTDIQNALQHWEPRIKLLGIDVELDEKSPINARNLYVTIKFEYLNKLIEYTYNISVDEEMLEGSIYKIRGETNATSR